MEFLGKKITRVKTPSNPTITIKANNIKFSRGVTLETKENEVGFAYDNENHSYYLYINKECSGGTPETGCKVSMSNTINSKEHATRLAEVFNMGEEEILTLNVNQEGIEKEFNGITYTLYEITGEAKEIAIPAIEVEN